MNKKAQGEDWIKEGIIAVVMIVLLMVLFYGITTQMKVRAQDSECSTSVTLASLGNGKLICPTTSKFIDTDDEDKIIDDILFEQYRCANKFHFRDGIVKKNPFKFWLTDSICVVCANISLSTKAKGKLKMMGPSNIEFRSTESYIPGTKKTYYQFFNGDAAAIEIKNDLKQAIESDEDYGDDVEKNFYVIYAVEQQSSDKVFWTSFVGGTGAVMLLTKAILPGKKLKIAGFILSVAAGAKTAEAITSKGELSVLQKASIAFVPQELDAIKELGCNRLGNDPFENPFEEKEIEEVGKIVEERYPDESK